MSGRLAIKGVPLRLAISNEAIRELAVAFRELAASQLFEAATPDHTEGPKAKLILKGGPFNGRSTRCKGVPDAIAVFHEDKVFFYLAEKFDVCIVARPGTKYVLADTVEFEDENSDEIE